MFLFLQNVLQVFFSFTAIASLIFTDIINYVLELSQNRIMHLVFATLMSKTKIYIIGKQTD